MITRKYSLVIAMLMCVLISFIADAQKPTYAHLTSGPVRKSSQLLRASEAPTDINNDTIAVLIVSSSLDNLVFDGSGVGKDLSGKPIVTKRHDKGIYEYTVGVLVGYDNVTVKHDKYAAVTVNLSSPAKPLEKWLVSITPVEAEHFETAKVRGGNKKYQVYLRLDSYSDIYVDEQPVKRSGGSKKTTVELEEGSHYITTKYKGKKTDQKIDVQKNGTTVDARFGGSVIVKNAKDVKLTGSDNPTPELIKHDGSTYEYDNMYGDYELYAKATGIKIGSVREKIFVGHRSDKTYYIDEMIPYSFALYHGSSAQPLGFSVGFCKQWGALFSFHVNIKSKINTVYGEAEIVSPPKEDDEDGEVEKSAVSTQCTFSAGPVWRFYRNFYLHVGIGCVRYISTETPKVLDPDFKAKWGFSTNAEVMWRFRNFVIGVGYLHQFMDHPYDPNAQNQVTFSAGVAF